MGNKNRRRIVNFSIKKKMQVRLLLGIMLVVFLSVGLASVFFYLMSDREIGQSYRQFHVTAKNFLEMLLPGVIMAFIIGIVSAVVAAVFLPHRIAGPLYRMERDIRDKIGEGNLTARFSIRDGDEVGELADTLNIMVGKLRGKVEKIKSASGEVSIASRQGDSGEKMRQAAGKLEEALKEFTI